MRSVVSFLCGNRVVPRPPVKLARPLTRVLKHNDLAASQPVEQPDNKGTRRVFLVDGHHSRQGEARATCSPPLLGGTATGKATVSEVYREGGVLPSDFPLRWWDRPRMRRIAMLSPSCSQDQSHDDRLESSSDQLAHANRVPDLRLPAAFAVPRSWSPAHRGGIPAAR